MKRKALFNMAASSTIIAASMVGCSGAALNNRAGVSAGKMETMAASQAQGAEKALAERDAGKAIQIAEAAVAANPQKAEYRTLLGRSYLMAGRFDSARASFADALDLGSTDARTIVNLSLIHVVQGRKEQGQRLLADHINDLSAADYGLAMAMAGNPEEAVRMLSQAIHAPGAGAKERQNLAYSYAMAGQWTEARQMAAMDLPPLDAAKRVEGWAQAAQPGAEPQRIVAMMGVSPRADDAGVPTRLALGKPTLSTPIRQAVATENFEPAAEQAQVAESASDTMPLELASFGMTEDGSSATPEFIAAPQGPMREAAPADAFASAPEAASHPLMRTDIPKARAAALWNPVDPSKGSRWVVQLGAFSTPDNARAGWSHYVRGNERLSLFPLVESEAVVGGRQFHRVAIAGFRNRDGAAALCARIVTEGGECFVREGGQEAAPSRWALAEKPRLLAMR